MPRWKWFQRSNEPVDVVQEPITNERSRVADESVKRNVGRVLPTVPTSANGTVCVSSVQNQKRRNGGEP